MPIYTYRGRDKKGEEVKGQLDTSNAAMAAEQLVNGEITPLEIKEYIEQRSLLGILSGIFEPKPTLIDLIIFSRQMATLSRAGVPIIKAINGLSESSENKIFKDILKDITKQLNAGRELTYALSRHENLFPTLYISIIRVGEESGQMEDAFLQMTRYLTLEKLTKERVKSAMRYPTMVFSAIFIAMIVINIFVIPTFADMFAKANAELPMATQILLATSNFTLAYWPYMLGGMVGGIFLLKRYFNTEKGRYKADQYKLKLPIVGQVIRLATLARFSRSFAMSLRAGVPITKGISMVAKAVDNVYVGEKLQAMRQGVEHGQALTKTAKETELFSPLVMQMLAVGEETGQIDELLLEVAQYYEEEGERKLESLSSAIEPILITFIGIMVLTLALGVFLPLWNMAGTVK